MSYQQAFVAEISCLCVQTENIEVFEFETLCLTSAGFLVLLSRQVSIQYTFQQQSERQQFPTLIQFANNKFSIYA